MRPVSAHTPNREGWVTAPRCRSAECTLGRGVLFGTAKPRVNVAVQRMTDRFVVVVMVNTDHGSAMTTSPLRLKYRMINYD